MSNSDSYTCERCSGTFLKGWTETEANNEAYWSFGDMPESEQAVICDDCYADFMSWFKSVNN